MSTKFVAPGDLIPYANTGSAILSGAVVVLKPGPGGMIGVAEDDIAATTGFGVLRVKGVVELACLSTDTGAIGDDIFWDATNTRLTTTRTGNTRAGILAATKATAITTAQVLLCPLPGGSLIGTSVAAGTALTNTTTETLLDSISIPANTLKAGDVLKVRYQGIATATNSTDTLAIKLYIGGLAGTALISAAAVDVANNDLFSGECTIVVRTAGATGTFVAYGVYKTTAAEGTFTCKDDVQASTTIDTTAAQVVGVSGTWSVANAGNSCRLDILTVERLR